MTHTLHRVGTPENLSEDYIFICLPANGINDAGSDPKLQEFYQKEGVIFTNWKEIMQRFEGAQPAPVDETP